MWCVAELNEEYIARMEDVLAVYEKPLLDKEPVVCVDEEPVALHAEVRPPRPLRRGGLPGATRSTNARAQPTCSVEYSPGLEVSFSANE